MPRRAGVGSQDEESGISLFYRGSQAKVSKDAIKALCGIISYVVSAGHAKKDWKILSFLGKQTIWKPFTKAV